MLALGIDLAWSEGTEDRPANRTGVVALAPDGTVLDAGWTTGVAATADWMTQQAGGRPCLAFVDAPLVVTNPPGTQRAAERQVSQRYWREKVAANSTNTATKRLAGVKLMQLLAECGWTYDDGRQGPPTTGLRVSECYPYTTIVGADALGYDVRPLYKRKPKSLKPAAAFKAVRAVACDDLIARVAALSEPPVDMRSHPVSRILLDEPSPLADRAYKQREDLLDALVAAWTARLWLTRGADSCQILGGPDASGVWSTLIAPCKPHQRDPSGA